MKFSNTTYGFYPSEDELLEAYSNLPDDLQDISDEDFQKFLAGDFGANVKLSSEGVLESRVVTSIIDYSVAARKLRDRLRSSIDTYLLPASTISDILVTEEQKNTLIQDSLSLAQWPAQEGWPYLPLPPLSELCSSLITVPDWSYPEQATTY
jgi:hypothetical protein